MVKIMKLKPNTKALLTGFLAGVILMCVLGIAQRSNEFVSFGMAVPSGSLVIVRDRMGWAWVIDPATATARGIGKAANERTFIQLP